MDEVGGHVSLSELVLGQERPVQTVCAGGLDRRPGSEATAGQVFLMVCGHRLEGGRGGLEREPGKAGAFPRSTGASVVRGGGLAGAGAHQALLCCPMLGLRGVSVCLAFRSEAPASHRPSTFLS